MSELNFLAVFVAAASAFLLGGLWYSPLVFLKAWSRESGFGDTPPQGGHPARVFGVSFLFSLIAATAFASWVGLDVTIERGVTQGLIVGFAFVAASFGINYQFANRSLKLWLIDGGYHVFQFMLYGLVLGAWPGGASQ